MVDLGFILISFFLFTTTLTRPTALRLIVPDKSVKSTSEAAADATITIYPGAKNVRYEDGKPGTGVMQSAFLDKSPSLRDIITARQQRLDQGGKYTRDSLVIIIKPDADVSYKQLIGVLDEMAINRVKKYMLVD
jgi:biopolymer transport protein ExbD